MATGPTIDKIAALDFVLFVEPIELTSAAHDQSTPLIDADMIRPGISFGLTRFSGAPIPVGILDTRLRDGCSQDVDLNKIGCGINFTNEAGTFDDQSGHGTHVLGHDRRHRQRRQPLPGRGPGRAGSIGRRHQGRQDLEERQPAQELGWRAPWISWRNRGAVRQLPTPLVINISGGTRGRA